MTGLTDELCPECSEPVSVVMDDPARGLDGPLNLQCANGHESWVPAETTARSRIAAVRTIARTGMAARVDGVVVDIQTASLLVKVYDILSPENREKFGRPSIVKLAEFAWSHVR